MQSTALRTRAVRLSKRGISSRSLSLDLHGALPSDCSAGGARCAPQWGRLDEICPIRKFNAGDRNRRTGAEPAAPFLDHLHRPPGGAAFAEDAAPLLPHGDDHGYRRRGQEPPGRGGGEERPGRVAGRHVVGRAGRHRRRDRPARGDVRASGPGPSPARGLLVAGRQARAPHPRQLRARRGRVRDGLPRVARGLPRADDPGDEPRTAGRSGRGALAPRRAGRRRSSSAFSGPGASCATGFRCAAACRNRLRDLRAARSAAAGDRDGGGPARHDVRGGAAGQPERPLPRPGFGRADRP